MRQALSTVLAVVLLLGLGVFAVLARSGEGAALATVRPSAAPAIQGDDGQSVDQAEAPAVTPLGTNKFNFIALPLDVTASVSPFTAAGLATYVGTQVKSVIRYDSAIQGFKTHTVGSPFNNFALALGGAYFLEVDATPVTVLSFVGGVPDQGTVSFALTRGASPTACLYTAISIPLDKSSITLASELATAIGGVNQVVNWDPVIQGFKTHTVGSPFNNFAIKIGYPYIVCVNSTGPASWP